MFSIAAALGKLPARIIWKLSKAEVEAAGGLEALNLQSNVMVMGTLRLPLVLKNSNRNSNFC